MGKKIIEIGDVKIGTELPFVLIAGPCQLESLDHSRMLAESICKICSSLDIKLIFKGSFDKANRTSHRTKRGLGIDVGLSILEKIKTEFECPVITDIHDVNQCIPASEVVDILQIPAFLCRQTDLLLKAGETGKAINVKKGQFLAPSEMSNVAQKISSTGNHNIMLCERGTSFGYNTLVNDFRGLSIMEKTGYPIVFDATHSTQQPGANIDSSGGQREHVPTLSKAACAIGIAALFMEIHQDPDKAPSDGPNMIHLSDLNSLLSTLKKIDTLVKTE